KEQVLYALGKTATKMRQKLGESLPSIQQYDVPLQKVTTPSLEALKAYSLGEQAMGAKADFPAAIQSFEHAISLDPNFAVAYSVLATAYHNMGQTIRAEECSRKAYSLRAQVSERERFYIEVHYQSHVTGNLEAQRKILELWTQTYPRDRMPLRSLAVVYTQL